MAIPMRCRSISIGRRRFCVVPPKKRAISIRLDEDVLDFFRDGGAGYQRRMNAVLRSYMAGVKKTRV